MDDLIRFQLPQSRFIAAVDPVIARAQHGMNMWLGPPWVDQIHRDSTSDHLPMNDGLTIKWGDLGMLHFQTNPLRHCTWHSRFKHMRFGDLWKLRKFPEKWLTIEFPWFFPCSPSFFFDFQQFFHGFSTSSVGKLKFQFRGARCSSCHTMRPRRESSGLLTTQRGRRR